MLLLYNQTILTLILVMTMFALLKLEENPLLCGSLDWREFGGEWILIHVWLIPFAICKNITKL